MPEPDHAGGGATSNVVVGSPRSKASFGRRLGLLIPVLLIWVAYSGAKQSEKVYAATAALESQIDQAIEAMAPTTRSPRTNNTKPSTTHENNITMIAMTTPNKELHANKTEPTKIRKNITMSTTTTPKKEFDGLTIWIHQDAPSDEKFIVSEKVPDVRPKHFFDVRLDNVRVQRCRNGTTTTPGTTGDGASSNATLLPNCPQNNTNTPIQFRKKQLLLCYTAEASNDTRIQNEDIAAVTMTISTTSPDSSSNSSSVEMHIQFEERDVIQYIHGLCPPKCNEPPHKNSTSSVRKKQYPLLWDSRDAMCKDTDPMALAPLRPQGGPCTCSTTCFTPQAFDFKSPWPWPSWKEYQSYQEPSMTPREINEKPRWQWIRSQATNEMRFMCPKTTTTPNSTANTTTDNKNTIRLSGVAKAGFQHHFMFIPQAKLIFCGVPKAGITEWLKFFRFVRGAKDYLSLPHFKEDVKPFQMQNLSLKKVNQLLSDPTWTKAIFFRDPAERLLSFYSNKIRSQGFSHKYFKVYNGTSGLSGPDQFGKMHYIMSFKEVVEAVTYNNTAMGDPRGLHGHTDPHFRSQSMMCGMDYLLPHVDFIGSFSHIAEHTRMLLERVGLWENYGAKFDPDNSRHVPKLDMCFQGPPPKRPANHTDLGFNQMGPSKTTTHLFGSKAKMQKFYTPKLLNKVQKAYENDYEIWNQIKDLPADQVLSGRDLNIVKRHCGL